VTGSASAWRAALGELPIVRGGRWAVGGSACLALHGLPVDPGDLDVLADQAAAAELVDGLRGAVVSDEADWDRGDVRAVRRALAVVHGVEVEILQGVQAVGPTGDVLVATPDLDHVDVVIVSGRQIPVLPLPVMQVLLDATGNRERAAMVAKALGERPSPAGPGAQT
jgi:Aminoglycoside-2''-adenylyltransferase